MKPEIASNWSIQLSKNKLPGNIKLPDRIALQHNNGNADWIGIQPGDTTPILFVSSIAGGKDWKDEDFDKLTGINHKCYSFAYAAPTSPMAHARHARYLTASFERGSHVFMDSGAHTLHRVLRSGKTLAKRYNIPKEQRKQFVEYLSEKFLELYCDYIKWSIVEGRIFDFYVTLDSQKNCELIYKTTKRLNKMGIFPASVYHGDDNLDWLNRYADDGHRFICIGIAQQIKGKDARRRYYDNVFKRLDKLKMRAHGLAVTGDKMLCYPWASVDSATHIKAGSFGKILVVVPEKQRIAQVHISENYSEFTSYGNVDVLSSAAKKNIKVVVEKNGFDYDKLRTDITYRIIYNAKVLQEACKANKYYQMKFSSWQELV